MRTRTCTHCERTYYGDQQDYIPPRDKVYPLEEWTYDPTLCGPCNQAAYHRSLSPDEHEREQKERI